MKPETPTKIELQRRIRALETDRRLLLEVASPEGRAVIRAAMARYRQVLKDFDGNLGELLTLAKMGCHPTAARLVRACAKLEKREKRNAK